MRIYTLDYQILIFKNHLQGRSKIKQERKAELGFNDRMYRYGT